MGQASAFNSKRSGAKYKWYVVILSGLIAFAFSLSMLCMPVLFKEISEDLGLSLVQVGTVWGMYPLGAIFATFMGGLLGDRFGAKRITGLGCILGGLATALRGLSGNFITLAITVLLSGLLMALVPGNTHKLCAIWFKRRLGLANALVLFEGGVGGVVAASLTATVLSPLLGSWKGPMFVYGALLLVIGIPVLLLRQPPGGDEGSASSTSAERAVPLRQALSIVFRNKNVWLLGLIFLGHAGGTIGMTGYLPLYLRSIGWTAASADNALAVTSAASMIGAFVIAIFSDRLGLRKPFVLAIVLSSTIGIGLLAVVGGSSLVWVAVILVGILRTGMMAIVMTMIAETEGIGVTYAGTASGVALTLSRGGSIFSPIIGNSLATTNPIFAFIFWAALSIVPLLCCVPFLKETGWRANKSAAQSNR